MYDILMGRVTWWLPYALAFAAFIALFAFQFWLKSFLYRLLSPRGAGGEQIRQSKLAQTHIANPPLDVTLVARAGLNAAPHKTLGTTFMRPTAGLRVISFGGTALLMAFTWFGPPDLVPPAPFLREGITVAVLYALLNIALYEARYDHTGLSAPNWFFQRGDYLWKNLRSITDNGHYLFELKFDDGRKVSIQKYLVGIPAFLTLAQSEIAKNESADAGVTRGRDSQTRTFTRDGRERDRTGGSEPAGFTLALPRKNGGSPYR